MLLTLACRGSLIPRSILADTLVVSNYGIATFTGKNSSVNTPSIHEVVDAAIAWRRKVWTICRVGNFVHVQRVTCSIILGARMQVSTMTVVMQLELWKICMCLKSHSKFTCQGVH